jgi:hypothetical protein
LKSQPVCVRCEEAEEPVYQGILEVKRGEEDDLQALKVCVNVKGQVYQGILEVKRGEEDDLQALKVCENVKGQVYQYLVFWASIKALERGRRRRADFHCILEVKRGHEIGLYALQSGVYFVHYVQIL